MDQIHLSQRTSVYTGSFSDRQSVQQVEKTTSSFTKRKESISSPEDKVSISKEGKYLAEKHSRYAAGKLTEAELQEVKELQKRDREVRVHEQAHLAAAGSYALGGAQLTTEKGPDGNSYATSGHVAVDISKENDPEATIAKMRTIRRAALAPARPSSADRQIAAKASMLEQQARSEINRDKEEGSVESIKPELKRTNNDNQTGQNEVSSHSFTVRMKNSNSVLVQNFNISLRA